MPRMSSTATRGCTPICALASAFRPDEMVRAIKAKVDLFTGDAPKFDDVTMLALRWQPAGARLQTGEA